MGGTRRARGVCRIAVLVAPAVLVTAGCSVQVSRELSPVDLRPRASGAASPGAGDPSGAGLRVAAQAYLDAVNAGDRPAATAMTCAGADGGLLFEVASALPVFRYEIASALVHELERGPIGEVYLGITGSLLPSPVPLLLFYERRGWCVWP